MWRGRRLWSPVGLGNTSGGEVLSVSVGYHDGVLTTVEVSAGSQIIFTPVGNYHRIRSIYHCNRNPWDETFIRGTVDYRLFQIQYLQLELKQEHKSCIVYLLQNIGS
jgi:hypothetical protein